jgi:nucleotide-binding universal stress UspA family protein
VIGLLLLSAVNTAVSALIGLFYMMARDGEMPRRFSKLNSHGVPWIPLSLAAALPLAVTAIASDLQALAGLYAIGVVGAITVNLGSCTFNLSLGIKWYERMIMGATFLVLFAVELTIARTRHDALFFACCVVGAGLGLRAFAHKRAGLKTLTVSQHIAAHVAPELSPEWRLNLSPGQSILVAARGLTPVLRYALEEARLRQATLYVLYIKEIAVTFPALPETRERPKWQHDREASRIMYSMIDLGRKNSVTVVPIYNVSDSPAATILDISATLGVDILMLGARQRRTLAQLFKGDVANQVAEGLPENIQLVIHA